MQRKHSPFFLEEFNLYKWLETSLLIAFKKASFSADFGPVETG
jgi:hypothetical protein